MLAPLHFFRMEFLDEFEDAKAALACRFYAADLMRFLEYDDKGQFYTVVQKALTSCTLTQMPVCQHFRPIYISGTHGIYIDYRLSIMACRLIIMNADSNRHAVAKAQALLARQR
ncbi:MAG: hypothetical protein HQK83_08770 [Fibrobacteria bacterium]|nr:hypothetical protein [Fibrobacteria bacterium]